MKKTISSFGAGVVTVMVICVLGTTALAATGQLTITVDPINIQVNGTAFAPKDTLGNSVPVFAYNGTTYAPLRALAEAYGLEVGYDSTSNMATVISKENNVPDEPTVKRYSLHENVPDFGAYFNAQTTEEETYDDGRTLYAYKISDISEAVSNGKLKEYTDYLKELGFQYMDSKDDKYLSFYDENTIITMGVMNLYTYGVIVGNY